MEPVTESYDPANDPGSTLDLPVESGSPHSPVLRRTFSITFHEHDKQNGSKTHAKDAPHLKERPDQALQKKWDQTGDRGEIPPRSGLPELIQELDQIRKPEAPR